MKRHVLFIVENNPVPFDVRVWNEALAAKEFGYEVSIICPQSKKAPAFYDKIDGIEIFRHFAPVEAASKYSFIFEYFNALFWEFFLSLYIFIKKPFQYIHSANPPDHIFIISLFFKLFKVKFIFDHHDITPENYIAKFGRKDFFYKMLNRMEHMSFRAADIVISTNNSYKQIAISRGNFKPEKVFVVRNGPNLDKVEFPAANKDLKSGFDYLVVYVGTIGNQEGIENLLEAVAYVIHQKGQKNIKFVIVGTGSNWCEMRDLSFKMNLQENVLFTGFIPYHQFYEYLATADLGVNPEHKNAFTDKSTMIKIMDYMTFGTPIVQFETREGKVSAGDAAVYVQGNQNDAFGEAIIQLLHNPRHRDKMGKIGYNRIFNEMSWNKQKLFLKQAYDYLAQNP